MAIRRERRAIVMAFIRAFGLKISAEELLSWPYSKRVRLAAVIGRSTQEVIPPERRDYLELIDGLVDAICRRGRPRKRRRSLILAAMEGARLGAPKKWPDRDLARRLIAKEKANADTRISNVEAMTRILMRQKPKLNRYTVRREYELDKFAKRLSDKPRRS